MHVAQVHMSRYILIIIYLVAWGSCMHVLYKERKVKKITRRRILCTIQTR